MNAWIKKIEEAIEEARLIPLWGEPPAFPWEAFSEKLSAALQLDARVECEKSAWKEPEEYLTGLGEEPYTLTLSLSPLPEPLFFAISSQDAKKLAVRCLGNGRGAKGFSHPDFQEGFLHYLWLQMLDLIDELRCFSDLSPKLEEKKPLPEAEGGFCHDLALVIDEQKVRGRLICPSSFHQAFRAHFSEEKPSLANSPLAKDLFVPLRLLIGDTQLKRSSWEKVAVGDLLVLDRCSFDPDLQKGSVELLLEKTPLFRGRIKEQSLKIIDYALTYEENMTPRDDENEAKNAEEEESFQTAGESAESAIETLLSTEEIPLTLTVEVGRLKMSVDKLLQLKAGNVLELGVTPKQGVHLTVEGKRVARGELVKIGELLGVRILDIKH